MARSRDRVIALILAIVFFATSLSVTFFAIWEVMQDDKGANTVNQNNANGQQALKGTTLANFTPGAPVDTLQKIDVTQGTGREVQPGDTVTVDYTGALVESGIIFESSYDRGEPVTFQLDGVIKGWTEGIPGMKVGGTRRLVIPAAMAYGANPREGSGIPPNAPLVFDVTVHDAQSK